MVHPPARTLRRLLLGALVILASAPALAAAPDPVEAVREVYRADRAFLKATAGKQGAKTAAKVQPPFEAPARARYFSRRLAGLLDLDERYAAAVNEVPYLDGDPLLDAQDWDDAVFDDLAIEPGPRAGDRAEVRVRFQVFGSPRDLRFDLVLERGHWRIDDIRNGESSLARGLAEVPRPCVPGWKGPCTPAPATAP
jgi:hypothetical protein